MNEVLNGISPNELPDIESDDDEEQKAASAAADHLAGVAVKDEDSSDNSDESDDDDVDSADAPMTPQQRRRANTTGAIGSKSLGKRDRHFWQYNVQAKGPKGQKIVVSTKIEDPHKLNDIVDPVFSGDVQLQGIKHRWVSAAKCFSDMALASTQRWSSVSATCNTMCLQQLPHAPKRSRLVLQVLLRF